MLKDLFYAFCILILLALISEGVLRIVQPESLMSNNLDLQKTEAMKKQPAFYQEHFCDAIHQNLRGEQLTAGLITKALKNSLDKVAKTKGEVWTVGASTTRGFNCDRRTSWPREVEQLNSGIKIDNLARDGAIAEESLGRIADRLNKGEKPALILWAHGMTELGFYGDGRDRGWDTLQSNPDRLKAIHQGSSSENLMIVILRLDLAFQQYSYAYRYFRALSAKLALNEFSGYFKFVAATTAGGGFNPREAYIFNQGPLGGPVRNLVSDPAQEYAADSYAINLKKAIALARENKIEFVCIIMPGVPRFYSFLSESFGEQFDAWVSKINQRTETVCRQLQAQTVDLRDAYRSRAALPESPAF